VNNYTAAEVEFFAVGADGGDQQQKHQLSVTTDDESKQKAHK
jgi:hypothetical protein